MAASGLGIGIGFTIAKILSPVVSAGIGALAGLFFVLFFDDTYLAITTQLGWGLPAWQTGAFFGALNGFIWQNRAREAVAIDKLK